MYMFRGNLEVNIVKARASEEIGIARQYLSSIFTCKRTCSKLVAYCITKYLDKDAEIDKYFIKVGE